MVTDLLLIIFFSLTLIKATDILLVNLISFSKQIKVGIFALSGLLVATAISLPELLVGLTAALAGDPNLSLGNVIGANIANLSLVIGGAALIGGAVKVEGEFLREDVFYAFLAGAAPMVLLVDKTLSRIDGLILLGLYLFYQTVMLRQQKGKAVNEKGMVSRFFHRLSLRKTEGEIIWIFLSMGALLFSANMLVSLGSKLALGLDLSTLVVGLVWIAVGTTLPELIFEAEAIREHQPAMVFGNLLGSIATNGTLVLGLVALISPIKVANLPQYLLATMAFVIAFSLFYLFIRTKRRLDRWEGAALVLVWLIFVLAEFLK